ncbi:lasso RiPP family leader peptide-containing protein [Croceicoccus hydrothermalis]|nr:lasso RiPP family leader peptide-containing protein [Croceicoccus hydrothermalis]
METLKNNGYEAPKMEKIGSFEELTLGSSTGNFLDADFPDGTPFGDLTFS